MDMMDGNDTINARPQGLQLKLFTGTKIILQDQKQNEKKLPGTLAFKVALVFI